MFLTLLYLSNHIGSFKHSHNCSFKAILFERYFDWWSLGSSAQRDRRKTEFLQVTAGQALELSPRTGVERGDRLRIGLYQRPEHVDLADIVYQSEQPPLYIHFALGA